MHDDTYNIWKHVQTMTATKMAGTIIKNAV